MTYTYLSAELHETAEAVRSHLIDNMGLKKVDIEKSTVPSIDFCPTLSGESPRGYMVFVEVSNSPYPKTLDGLVLDCVTNQIPVKLYVANPVSQSGKIDEKEVRRLSKKNIGYLIVGTSGVEEIRGALELSLFLPEISPKSIPKSLRPAIHEACNTYQNGNPVKGVATLCDEIEDLIRKNAKKAKKTRRIPASCTINFDRGRLANIIDTLNKHRVMRKPLIGKCYTLTEIRNDSSHPPKNFRKRTERHKKLRTNFMWAIDLLKQLRSCK